jgi:hypothetical protein
MRSERLQQTKEEQAHAQQPIDGRHHAVRKTCVVVQRGAGPTWLSQVVFVVRSL